MKAVIQEKTFRPETLEMIDVCNEILEQYDSEGYKLTVRQLYYQIVANDLFPYNRRWAWTGNCWQRDPDGTVNAQPNYEWLARIVNDARMAGYIDWDLIVDLNRETERYPHWETPKDALFAMCQIFSLDRWKFQPIHVEVMCEKQALEGILLPVCRKYDVPYTSNKGYTSQSFMWNKGIELANSINNQKENHILYFGDHDPSGLDMDRDIETRLAGFINVHATPFGGPHVLIHRVALTYDQIERYNPPPNPAKLTDSRATEYIKNYGDYSWELDALTPEQLDNMLSNAIEKLIHKCGNHSVWNDVVELEERMKKQLTTIYKNCKDSKWISEVVILLQKMRNEKENYCTAWKLLREGGLQLEDD